MSLRWAEFIFTFIVVSSIIIGLSVIGDNDLNSVQEACKSGLEFVKISQFRHFLGLYKVLLNEDATLEKFKLPSKCVKHKQDILDLESIITRTTKVCDPEHIQSMLDYDSRYVSRSSITKRIFRLYSIQVAFTCKRNLLKNLETSSEEMRALEHSISSARDSIYAKDPRFKTNMQFIATQSDGPIAGNVKPMGQSQMVMAEYREFLTKLNRVEYISTFNPKRCQSKKVKVKLSDLEKIFKSASICHQMSRYYSGSILSLARLANRGYSAQDDELNHQLEDNNSVREWLILVQVCESLTHMRRVGVSDSNQMVELDTCTEQVNVIESFVYDDDFEDIDDVIVQLEPLSKPTANTARKAFSRAVRRLQFYQSRSKKSSNGINNNHEGEDHKDKFTPRFMINDDELIAENEQKSVEALESLCDDDEEEHVEGGDTISKFAFEPTTWLLSSLTILSMMLAFEWIFFIVLSVAAKICHSNFYDMTGMLRFPPKFPSLSESNFARYQSQVEELDEDEFIDYDEQTDKEREQKQLLKKIFGRPPPLKYRY